MVKIRIDHNIPYSEFKEYSGSFEVSFKFRKPIGTTQNSFIWSEHQLIVRRADILKILTTRVDMTLNEIAEKLKDAPEPRTIRYDLSYLKKLKLITLSGFGRGAK